jgi:hypothetical protein
MLMGLSHAAHALLGIMEQELQDALTSLLEPVLHQRLTMQTQLEPLPMMQRLLLLPLVLVMLHLQLPIQQQLMQQRLMQQRLMQQPLMQQPLMQQPLTQKPLTQQPLTQQLPMLLQVYQHQVCLLLMGSKLSQLVSKLVLQQEINLLRLLILVSKPQLLQRLQQVIKELLPLVVTSLLLLLAKSKLLLPQQAFKALQLVSKPHQVYQL